MRDNDRKTIIISITLALVVFISIFAWFKAIQSSYTSTSVAAAQEEDVFEVVDCHNTTLNITVMYHKQTKVMYIIPRGGTATVMVGADGKPLLYEP